MEKEIDNKLPFLNVFLDNSSTSLKTSVFRKKTFTGLLTAFNSFTSFSYKSGLVIFTVSYKKKSILTIFITL